MTKAETMSKKQSLLYVPQGSTNPVYRLMCRELSCGDGYYYLCGEVLLTPLAEAAASAFDRTEWLDDDEHWIWDVSYAAAIARGA